MASLVGWKHQNKLQKAPANDKLVPYQNILYLHMVILLLCSITHAAQVSARKRLDWRR